jgi:hypothetical protein
MIQLHTPTTSAYGQLAAVIATSPLAWHSRARWLCALDRHFERDDEKRFARFAARAARLFAGRGM